MNHHHSVMLAGDWHGNTAWAVKRIDEAADDGVRLILQRAVSA
ncbi:MAG: hypothetical protein WCP28_22210 [Actinomycetes bacterium]